MLETKRLAELTYEDVREFVELGLEENARLDYKEEITKDLAKHVSAMANTEGGHIVIGVEEEDEDESGKKRQLNVPKPRDAIVGVEHEGKDLRAKCRDIVVARTNPRVAPEVKQIPLPDDGSRMVVVVSVEPSANAPHELIQGQERRIFVRKHDSSVPATLDEIERMIERRNRLREERFGSPPDFGRSINGMRHPRTGADPSALSVVIRPRRVLPARFELGYDSDQKLREIALNLELMERIEVSPIPQGAALLEYRNINPAEKVLVGRAEVAINGEMRLARVMERENRRPAIGHGQPRTLDFAEPAHFLQQAIFFAANAYARAGREVELEAYFELVGCTGWTVDIPANTSARPPRGYRAEISGRPLSYVAVGARPDAEELLTVVRELGRALGLSVPDIRLKDYLLDLRLLEVEY